MPIANEHTELNGNGLLSFKEIVARVAPRNPKYVRKVVQALEGMGKLHRFQPTPRVHPRWYASEIAAAIAPERGSVSRSNGNTSSAAEPAAGHRPALRQLHNAKS